MAQPDLEGTWELCCLELVRPWSSLGAEKYQGVCVHVETKSFCHCSV